MRRCLRIASVFLGLTALVSFTPRSRAAERVDLNSSWRFTIDPMRIGEKWNWHGKDLPSEGQWTALDVPHCWPADPRTPHTGAAWYRRNFSVPKDAANRHVRLVFDAVFYRARVWVNGRFIGEHEGGYTPFEFDITGAAPPGERNTLAVEVDNSWSTETIPGARPGGLPRDQVNPWFNYGGIVRDVYLLISSPVHIANQRVVATPNLADGTAAVRITAWVSNPTPAAARVELAAEIQNERTGVLAASWRQNPSLRTSAEIPPRSTSPVEFEVRLPRSVVELWDQDHPNLYRLAMKLSGVPSGQAGSDTHEVTFGIRSIEVRKTQLLLNGKPIRMGGVNRYSDHPEFGMIEPKQVIDQDLSLMKRANMELAQPPHYPMPPAMFDWADRHGLLMIEEVGNVWMTSEQMDSPKMRRLFQSQTEEMIRRDWNHPSVIGYSIGNEYDSTSPAGLRWTRDITRSFVAWTLAASLRLAATDSIARHFGEEFRSRKTTPRTYVDLISLSIYGPLDNVAKSLDIVHRLYPDKPVYINQWGSLGESWGKAWSALPALDRDPPEKIRDYISGFAAVLRERPWVVGASYWAFADYRSLWPGGTFPDGYRHLGALTRERKPRPVYEMLREEFSPVVIRDITVAGTESPTAAMKTVARVRARADFPSYELRDYEVRWQVLDGAGAVLGHDSRKIDLLRPGEERAIDFQCAPEPRRGATTMRFEIVRPTGFIATERTVEIPHAPSNR